MTGYDYVIIGGGMTADAAVGGIRSVDKSGTIGLFTMEPNAPYKRPPLSKALWKGDPLESIWLKSSEGAQLHLSTRVSRIDRGKKQIIAEKNQVFEYRKLLLATGGSVRTLPQDAPGIIYFRTVDDYTKLRKIPGGDILVIGGGFIGSEIAAALALNGKRVSMIFPEGGIGARVYPEKLSKFVTEYYRSKGVNILGNNSVEKIGLSGGTYTVGTRNGEKLTFDGVVAGIGIQPNTELAAEAGLSVNNGIVVDEYLRTDDPHIYSAGDVANFPNPALGKRIRVEHEDNALTMGSCAGKNMAGESIFYRHLPFFYSDLFDLGYEAVGELDSRLQAVEDWKEEFREGVIYFLDRERVRGVLLWNTWGQVDRARALIADSGPFSAASLKGRLPA